MPTRRIHCLAPAVLLAVLLVAGCQTTQSTHRLAAALPAPQDPEALAEQIASSYPRTFDGEHVCFDTVLEETIHELSGLPSSGNTFLHALLSAGHVCERVWEGRGAMDEACDMLASAPGAPPSPLCAMFEPESAGMWELVLRDHRALGARLVL